MNLPWTGKLVAVLRAPTAEAAYEQGVRLAHLGVRTLEVTFTVPNAANVIERLRALSDVRVGAGTICTPRSLHDAVSAGAHFAMSPGLDAALVVLASNLALPYLPGVMTPSEVMGARELGCHTVKLFPGEVLGPGGLKALREPFPNVGFVVTGGVTPTNVRAWLEAGASSVGMGSALSKLSDEDVRTLLGACR